MARISSQRKVLAKYPEADIVHQRLTGLTFYIIRQSPEHHRTALGEGISKSKAWVNAAKRIESGQEPYHFR